MAGPGVLVGVGVGPGDPSLLTIRGRDVLVGADALFVPVAGGDQPGYAERVVRAHVPPDRTITRLEFAVTGDEAARRAAWEQAAERITDTVAAGGMAAFATIGDPNVYSTFTHLARAVTGQLPAVRVETVPGITAMQDLAARSGTTLVEHRQRLALLPLTAGGEHVRGALADWDTVVLYKGGRRLPAVRRLIDQAGRLDQAVFGARLGLEGEQVRAGLPAGQAPYLSTIIVGPVPGRP